MRGLAVIQGSRCLVTGGAGFLGRHLVDELLRRGADEIVVLDRLREGSHDIPVPASARCKRLIFQLGRDCLPALRRHLNGVDYVFHLAAEKHAHAQHHPDAALDSNIDGTYGIARAASEAGVKRIIFASSVYVYGRMHGPTFSETETPLPNTIYGISKLAGEHLVRYCHSRYNVAFNVLRYFFTYGPGQSPGSGYKSVIGKTIERLLLGQPPVIYGDGNQVFDYVYVSDVIDATIRAAESEAINDVFNIGSGLRTSIADLIGSILTISGRHLPIEYGERDDTFGSSRVADIRKAAERLQWHPQTSLMDGLTMTYDWLASQRK
jgi:UDP-glucose 4-epimerase